MECVGETRRSPQGPCLTTARVGELFSDHMSVSEPELTGFDDLNVSIVAQPKTETMGASFSTKKLLEGEGEWMAPDGSARGQTCEQLIRRTRPPPPVGLRVPDSSSWCLTPGADGGCGAADRGCRGAARPGAAGSCWGFRPGLGRLGWVRADRCGCGQVAGRVRRTSAWRAMVGGGVADPADLLPRVAPFVGIWVGDSSLVVRSWFAFRRIRQDQVIGCRSADYVGLFSVTAHPAGAGRFSLAVVAIETAAEECSCGEASGLA